MSLARSAYPAARQSATRGLTPCRGLWRELLQLSQPGTRPLRTSRSSRCYCLLLIAIFLKVFDRVRDRSKAIDLADMLLDSLRAEPIAHRGTSFDNLQARASCFDVVSHVHDYAARLNVHMR